MITLSKLSLVAFYLISIAQPTPLSPNPPNAHSHSPLSLAQLVVTEHPYGTINNSYIVVLKSDLSPSLKDNHFSFLKAAHENDPFLSEDSGIQHVYDGSINGYAGRFTRRVIDLVRARSEVAYIEQDQIVRITDVQHDPPWGLARISHRPRLSPSTGSTASSYEYSSVGGEGVDVYVLDTGIYTQHQEFEGRASWGITIPKHSVDADMHGHGTHCAGTIASRKYGIAKKANVIAVKVLGSNGSGSMSDFVAGVDWTYNQVMKKAKAAEVEYRATGTTTYKGSVANISLGGGRSKALDDAVNNVVDQGLHFSVAAGNDNRDACQYSPAAAEKPITVGASNLCDQHAPFSNHGSCVDVFAPGQEIVSTGIGSPTDISTRSGTSMAAPHTAGLLAYLLSIYPSEQFNPVLDSDPLPPSSPQRTYADVHAVLPFWVSAYLPSQNMIMMDITNAPIPEKPKTLSPMQLKQAVIALSSRGLLTGLPPQTVNLLIFNNATREMGNIYVFDSEERSIRSSPRA